jgi:hypothetical protein
MLVKKEACSGAFWDVLVGILGVLFFVAVDAGFALAFPTQTPNATITDVDVLPPSETEHISLLGRVARRPVYMGPYQMTGTIGGVHFATAMMCFKAGAGAGATYYTWATMNTVQAVQAFGADFAAKVRIVAWYASQGMNADISRALWKIWADDGTAGRLDLANGKPYSNTCDIDTTVTDTNQLLADALEHTTDVTAAGYLTPLLQTADRTKAYEKRRQPLVRPVLDPATVLLLGSALVGVGLYGWRRRDNANR